MAEPSKHDAAAAAIESAFLRREGVPDAPPPPSGKPRAADGKFTSVTPDAAPAEAETAGTEAQDVTETEGAEPVEGQPAQSEDVEVEIEGEKYLVPKKISDRFIQHADYTRGKQDLAELRRVTSAERETHNLEVAFAQATAKERQDVALLDAQIAQYQTLNWGAIEDTGQVIKLRAQFDQLKDRRAEIDKQIRAKRGGFDAKINQVRQEAIRAGVNYINQHIKGYDAKLQNELHEYSQSQGYSRDEMTRIFDPRFVVLLHKASQWDALKASQPEITRRAANAAPVVRPGVTQRQVSKVEQATRAIQKAQTPKEKARATEDYLALRLGGGR